MGRKTFGKHFCLLWKMLSFFGIWVAQLIVKVQTCLRVHEEDKSGVGSSVLTQKWLFAFPATWLHCCIWLAPGCQNADCLIPDWFRVRAPRFTKQGRIPNWLGFLWHHHHSAKSNWKWCGKDKEGEQWYHGNSRLRNVQKDKNILGSVVRLHVIAAAYPFCMQVRCAA